MADDRGYTESAARPDERESIQQAQTWKRSAAQKAEQNADIDKRQKELSDMDTQQIKSDSAWGKDSPKPLASTFAYPEPNKKDYEDKKKDLEKRKKLNNWWRD